jgi:hypothetical protein
MYLAALLRRYRLLSRRCSYVLADIGLCEGNIAVSVGEN